MSYHIKTTEERDPDAMVRPPRGRQDRFLGVPEPRSESRRLFDEDVTEVGYVMSASRLWAYQPATMTGLFNLLRQASAADVQAPRDAGFSDAQIFTITVFVALRLAFSTVNDALGLGCNVAVRRVGPGAGTGRCSVTVAGLYGDLRRLPRCGSAWVLRSPTAPVAADSSGARGA